MSAGSGTVLTHTTVRVAGTDHADEVPFVLLLVVDDDGDRRLGRFAGDEPPPIGARVAPADMRDGVPIFKAT